MFKRLFLYLFVIVTFISASEIDAVEVQDLYQASVVVESQTSRDRTAALKDALAAVLLKVGGDKKVLEQALIKQALIKYQQYLEQYRYQYKTIRMDSEPHESQPLNQKKLYLFARFNETKINQLFKQANLPLWGSLRPQVLLWLIDEKGFTRNIMSNSSDSALPFVVNNFSERRGLPIIMPLMDLTDATQIHLSDIWGRFEQPVRVASSRYSAEAIIVMRISDSSLLPTESMPSEQTNKNAASDDECGLLCVDNNPSVGYVLDWSLITQKQMFSEQYQGTQKQMLLEQGLSDITDIIYQYYALSADNANEFIINVANVDSMRTYEALYTFLHDLSSVNSVTLMKAKGTSREFKLSLLGTKESFLASLKLNKQLTQYIDPLADMNNNSEEASVPVFYWGNNVP